MWGTVINHANTSDVCDVDKVSVNSNIDVRPTNLWRSHMWWIAHIDFWGQQKIVEIAKKWWVTIERLCHNRSISFHRPNSHENGVSHKACYMCVVCMRYVMVCQNVEKVWLSLRGLRRSTWRPNAMVLRYVTWTSITNSWGGDDVDNMNAT